MLLLLVLVALLQSATLTAQDEELQHLIFLLVRGGDPGDAEARSLQVYRIPVAFTLRPLDERRLGLRFTCPVSLGANEIQASTGVGDLLERFASITVSPGLEAAVRVAPGWQAKPFVELGLTASDTDDAGGPTYGYGVRVRGEEELRTAHLLLGAAARRTSLREDRRALRDYSTFELGADLQVPLGVSVWRRAARGGVFGIVRYFPDLEGPAGSVDVAWLYEAGVSFSTVPELRLWRVGIPRVALGYRWGGPLSGIRIGFSFPF